MTQIRFPSGDIIDFGDRAESEIKQLSSNLKTQRPELFVVGEEQKPVTINSESSAVEESSQNITESPEQEISNLTYETFVDDSSEGQARFQDAKKVLELFDAVPEEPEYSKNPTKAKQQKNEYRQTVLDEVLERKRGFEISSVSLVSQAAKINNATREQLEAYQRTAKNIDAMPNFYEKGGAPAYDALTEGLFYTITDPLNTIGAILGVASLGAGSAATFGTKTAAKEGVRQYVKNRIKFLTSKPMLKVAAVDAAVAGTGQVATEAKRQKTEIELGVRDEIDRGEILLTGALMGPGSVVMGQALGVTIGAGVRASSSAASKVLPETVKESSKAATNWARNNLLPKSFGDKISLEIAEEIQGASNYFNQAAIKVASSLEKNLNKSFKTKEEKNQAINAVNRLLDGDEPKFKLSDDTLELVNQAKIVIKEAQEYATSTPNLKSAFRAVFREGDDYSRFVYEVFSVSKRAMSYPKFLKENPEVLKELSNEVVTNPKWFESLPKSIKRNLKVSDFANNVTSTKTAKNLGRRLYAPNKGNFDVTKSTRVGRVNVPEVVQTIWGKNYSPSTRITGSVQGITNAIEKARFGTTLAKSLNARKLAVKASSKQKALEKLNKERAINRLPLLEEDDLVRVVGSEPQDILLVSGKQGFKVKPVDDSLIPITNANRIITSAGKNYWTTKEVQNRLKPVTNMFKEYEPLFANPNSVLEWFVVKAGELNGSLKLGKTVLAPIVMIRNGYSATVALVATGALRNPIGLVKDFKSLLKSAPPGQLRAIFNEGRKLGVGGTSIDLNQSLSRLGRDLNEDPRLVEKVFSFGLASLAPNKYKALLKFYGGTDDFLKTFVYLSEVRSQQRVWNTLTKQEKANAIKLLQSKLGTKVNEQEYIAKIAASNTKDMMPVYSRVPAITESTFMRKIPVLGTFSAYPAEMWRNAYNIVRLGTEEMELGFRTNNTEIVKNGASRVMSLYATIAGTTFTSNHINEYLGVTDKVKSLVSFLPTWAKHANIVMGDIIKRGNDIIVEYYNADQSMPYKDMANAVNPLFVSLAEGESSEKVLDTFVTKSATNFLRPFAGPSLTLGLVNEFKNIITSDDEATKTSRTRAAYKIVEPGYVKTTRDIAYKLGFFSRPELADIERILYPSRFGSKKPAPKKFSELANVLIEAGFNPAGVQLQEVNLTQSSVFVARDIYDKYRKGRQATQNELTQLFSTDYDLNPDSKLVQDFVQEYENVLQESFIAQQGIRKLYEDVRKLAGEEEAKKILFTNPNVKAAFGSNKVKASVVINNEHFSNPIFTKAKMKKDYFSYKNNPNFKRLYDYFFNTNRDKDGNYAGKLLSLEQKYMGLSLDQEVPKVNEE